MSNTYVKHIYLKYTYKISISTICTYMHVCVCFVCIDSILESKLCESRYIVLLCIAISPELRMTQSTWQVLNKYYFLVVNNH